MTDVPVEVLPRCRNSRNVLGRAREGGARSMSRREGSSNDVLSGSLSGAAGRRASRRIRGVDHELPP